MICSICGEVLSERPSDFGPEWWFLSDKKSGRERGGPPTSLAMHDMGLATIINPQNRDASGKPLTTPMKRSIQRLRIWDSRSQTLKLFFGKDENLKNQREKNQWGWQLLRCICLV